MPRKINRNGIIVKKEKKENKTLTKYCFNMLSMYCSDKYVLKKMLNLI